MGHVVSWREIPVEKRARDAALELVRSSAKAYMLTDADLSRYAHDLEDVAETINTILGRVQAERMDLKGVLA